MICEACGEEDDVMQCPNCESTYCSAHRPNDICATCGATVQDNAKCSLSGGCGDGRQET